MVVCLDSVVEVTIPASSIERILFESAAIVELRQRRPSNISDFINESQIGRAKVETLRKRGNHFFFENALSMNKWVFEVKGEPVYLKSSASRPESEMRINGSGACNKSLEASWSKESKTKPLKDLQKKDSLLRRPQGKDHVKGMTPWMFQEELADPGDLSPQNIHDSKGAMKLVASLLLRSSLAELVSGSCDDEENESLSRLIESLPSL